MYWRQNRGSCLAALGLLAACGFCLALAKEKIMADEKESTQITLTEKDNDTKPKLSLGDQLVVYLETQPGTGFSWVIAQNNKDQLTLLSKVLLENPNMVPGGKTIQVFTFRAAAAGKSDLELYYKRPFEKDKEPAKKFKASVTISK